MAAPKLQECVQGNVVLYVLRYYIPPLFNILQVCNGHFWICCKAIAFFLLYYVSDMIVRYISLEKISYIGNMGGILHAEGDHYQPIKPAKPVYHFSRKGYGIYSSQYRQP